MEKKRELKIEFAPLDKALLEKRRRELRIPKPKKKEKKLLNKLIKKKKKKKKR